MILNFKNAMEQIKVDARRVSACVRVLCGGTQFDSGKFSEFRCSRTPHDVHHKCLL